MANKFEKDGLLKDPSVMSSLEARFSQILGDPDKIEKTILRRERNLDGNGSYWVLDPIFNYRGKSYSELVCDWFNWFVSADADKRKFGPTVFLRSKGLPNEETGANISDVPGEKVGAQPGDASSQPDYLSMGTYVNHANVMTGKNRLQIFENQAVLVPIITAYGVIDLNPPNNSSIIDWGSAQDFVRSLIDNGDNPPGLNQLTINGENVVLPKGRKMDDFKISTPLFPAVVPDVAYGRSIKDFLEEIVAPGNYAAVVDGYFVLIRFTEGHYWVHSWASAGPEQEGVDYFSELLYQIEVVKPKASIGVRTAYRPARNEQLLAGIVEKIGKKVPEEEVERFKKYVKFNIL